MSAAEGSAASGQVPQSTALALQCVTSVIGTMVGEAIGDTLAEKLVAGLLLCVIGAFLTAPGRHHRRRVVAVTLLLALLDGLRRAAGALASTRRGAPRGSLAAAASPASWGAVAVATVVGFGLGSAGTTALGNWPEGSDAATVAVPAVAGQREERARALLQEAGLAAVRASAPSVSVRRGFAIRTEPGAGSEVRRGAGVTLHVSSGPPGTRLRVPAVRGLPESEARALLTDLGLRVRRAEAPSEQIARGRATATSPPADTRVRAGARVTLFVSAGPADETVTVPAVAGRSEREALALLRAAGLDSLVRPTPSEDVREGRATGTQPPAGREVERGARVRLLVSSGPEVERVEVPQLAGDALDEARARLEALGLRARRVSEDSSEPAGSVIRSDPAAGTLVSVASEVQLVVSTGALVRVPNVVGMTREDAQGDLKGAGLGSAVDEVKSKAALDTVTATQPAAREEVARGTTVTISVSCGACID